MTMKRKIGVGTLLFAMLLVCLVLVPVVSAQENATKIKELTFGPGTFDELKSDSNFIAAHGSIPTFKTSEERKQWLSTLATIYDKANKKLIRKCQSISIQMALL